MFLVDMRSFSNISHPDPPCARRPTRVLRPKPQTLLFCASIGSWLDQDTPFGRLAKRVFFGDSDAFRDERLKLIPKVSAASVTTTVAVAVALSPVIWRGKPLTETGRLCFFFFLFFPGGVGLLLRTPNAPHTCHVCVGSHSLWRTARLIVLMASPVVGTMHDNMRVATLPSASWKGCKVCQSDDRRTGHPSRKRVVRKQALRFAEQREIRDSLC